MINRDIIRNQFDNYVKDYDADNIKISLKIIHTYRVAELCEKIANSLGMYGEEADLAWTVGMLHDIGRFEQVKRYNTFRDKDSVDHAKFGVKLLFEEDLIKKFQLDEKYYSIVRISICNHNLFRIESGLSDEELTYCKIIRDADKIDILRVNSEVAMEDLYNTTREILENDCVSDEVYDAFFKGIAIQHNLKRTTIDHLVGHLSLSSELEYPMSIQILKESGYLDKMLEFRSNVSDTNDKLKKIAMDMSRRGLLKEDIAE